MTDKRADTYNLYLSAWSKISDSEREDRLNRSVVENIVFRNAMQNRSGIRDLIDHLEVFQARSSGGSFRMNWMLGFGTDYLVEWQLVDAEGKAGFTGFDALTFNDKGSIETIVLWSNLEKQKLA